MSLAQVMDEKQDDIRKANDRKSRRLSFWSGVLEGISGPLMMATRPQGRVKIKVTDRDGDTVVSSVENSFRNVGDSMRRAASTAATDRGLIISSRPVKVLGSDGKSYVVRSPIVRKRGTDESQK